MSMVGITSALVVMGPALMALYTCRAELRREFVIERQSGEAARPPSRLSSGVSPTSERIAPGDPLTSVLPPDEAARQAREAGLSYDLILLLHK